jgi:hypothetical protein
VDYFFGVILGSQLDEISLRTIAEFLSTDIVKKHNSIVLDKHSSVSTSTGTKSPTSTGITKAEERPTKEGYLTKRGKNFGGWQPRYFVLDGPQLKYFDAVCCLKDSANPSQMEFILVVLNYLKPRLGGRLLNLEQNPRTTTKNK